MGTGGVLGRKALATAELLKTCGPQGGPSRASFPLEVPRVWSGLPPSLIDTGRLRDPAPTSGKQVPLSSPPLPPTHSTAPTSQRTDGHLELWWVTQATWSPRTYTVTTGQISWQVPIWETTKAKWQGAWGERWTVSPQSNPWRCRSLVAQQGLPQMGGGGRVLAVHCPLGWSQLENT